LRAVWATGEKRIAGCAMQDADSGVDEDEHMHVEREKYSQSIHKLFRFLFDF
jgi:hypothetical protein